MKYAFHSSRHAVQIEVLGVRGRKRQMRWEGKKVFLLVGFDLRQEQYAAVWSPPSCSPLHCPRELRHERNIAGIIQVEFPPSPLKR